MANNDFSGLVTDPAQGLGIPFMLVGPLLAAACSAIYIVVSLLTPAMDPEEVAKVCWDHPLAFLEGRITGASDPRMVSLILIAVVGVLYYLIEVGFPLMEYRPLGRTGLNVSRLSFGLRRLGGVFRSVEESRCHRGGPCGPGLRHQLLRRRARLRRHACPKPSSARRFKGIPRERYYLSTKVGKYTAPGKYGDDTLDYSRARIRASLDESARRLGSDYFDIIHIHDIEYQGRRHAEWALTEGLAAVQELKREGRIGAVSFGIYPMDLWKRIFADYEIDAATGPQPLLLERHATARLVADRPQTKGIGIINGSPFASGLLTDRGPADWHPASPEDRRVFRRAAEFCRCQGTSISKLALQILQSAR